MNDVRSLSLGLQPQGEKGHNNDNYRLEDLTKCSTSLWKKGGIKGKILKVEFSLKGEKKKDTVSIPSSMSFG